MASLKYFTCVNIEKIGIKMRVKPYGINVDGGSLVGKNSENSLYATQLLLVSQCLIFD